MVGTFIFVHNRQVGRSIRVPTSTSSSVCACVHTELHSAKYNRGDFCCPQAFKKNNHGSPRCSDKMMTAQLPGIL